MYKCKHFHITELVPQSVYLERGERAWELLDERMLITADQLNDRFGQMIVNTWNYPNLIKKFGYRDQSGLRTETVGAKYSQHFYGRAMDALFTEVTAAEVRKYVLSHASEFPHLAAIEVGVRWFHFDTRNCERIKVFKP